MALRHLQQVYDGLFLLVHGVAFYRLLLALLGLLLARLRRDPMYRLCKPIL
jgi:hypothetical protein